ncbi:MULTISPECIES: bifunctional phosphopantothenoylcysteine decarboxylase/phosphopantothenate--cysteine ligase CoaBC [unclassified Archaeoglobus]|uniref:bifunctional phosphopantothenoylcysteine decarboxylase/phosphopantothenate--cysteine ligase CoaBC n=1 Tax=unclassified Archaeoglobus TaxID=2643606 RepID=UPI0025C242EF|nr:MULTISPECIES: bifunctional phosphopantothenoylcysteine decarboxylase/phosphopantothenate--cysteine ligase CoaBC [unclassified Archaeoglobus]
MHLERIKGKKSRKLEGKRVVLGVTGSIAAVESVKLARELVRRGADVVAVMSKAARKIIHPYALEFATGRKTITEITGNIEHVNYLGIDGDADLYLIAPATANTISKIAQGIDDTPVTTFATTALGSGKPIIIVPAMHESMMKNKAVLENIQKLVNMGIEIVQPRIEEGKAKFPDLETICLHVERELYSKELKGKKVIVTSGPTYEQLDPIRFISNKSSGKMGKEIALEMWRRGAEVTLITSKSTNLRLPMFREIRVWSVKDMLKAVLYEIEKGCDIFVSSAAASDFIVDMEAKKIKTTPSIELKLREAPKIIKEVRKIYKGHIIGFKAETGVTDGELLKIAGEKLEEDALNMVVANDVLEKGMGTEDTRVLILTQKRQEWVEGLKIDVAEKIVKAYIEDCL